MVLVSAAPRLTSGAFCHGPLRLRAEQWTEVDANDPAVRAVLLAYVPTHIRVSHGQDAEIQAAGLAFVEGKLVELPKPADPKTDEKKKPPKSSEK